MPSPLWVAASVWPRRQEQAPEKQLARESELGL